MYVCTGSMNLIDTAGWSVVFGFVGFGQQHWQMLLVVGSEPQKNDFTTKTNIQKIELSLDASFFQRYLFRIP